MTPDFQYVIDYHLNQALMDMEKELSCLERIPAEYHPVLTRLLTGSYHDLCEAFLGNRIVPGTEDLVHGYTIEGTLIGVLSFITHFILHEMIDDGSPGLIWICGRSTIVASGEVSIMSPKKSLIFKQEIRDKAIPHITTNYEMHPLAVSADMKEVVLVLDHALNQSRKLRDSFKARNPDAVDPLDSDHRIRIQMAKDLGLVPAAWQYLDPYPAAES